MKTMTCKQLGGACDLAFHAETFEEMAELSKQHGLAKHKEQDEAHLAAMRAMSELMQKPEEMQKWFASKRQEFELLAHN